MVHHKETESEFKENNLDLLKKYSIPQEILKSHFSNTSSWNTSSEKGKPEYKSGKLWKKTIGHTSETQRLYVLYSDLKLFYIGKTLFMTEWDIDFCSKISDKEWEIIGNNGLHTSIYMMTKENYFKVVYWWYLIPIKIKHIYKNRQILEGAWSFKRSHIRWPHPRIKLFRKKFGVMVREIKACKLSDSPLRVLRKVQ